MYLQIILFKQARTVDTDLSIHTQEIPLDTTETLGHYVFKGCDFDCILVLVVTYETP